MTNLLALHLRDAAALRAAWMPFIRGGGLFVPSTHDHRLGEAVFLLLTLPGEAERIPVAGQVVWLSPTPGPDGPRGIGIQLTEADEPLMRRIEALIES